MQLVKRVGILMLIAVAAACAPAAPPEPTVDLAAEEAAVRAVSARWLALEGERDAAGIAGLFAQDGRLVWAGQDPIVGPDAIQAHLAKEFEANPQRTATWTTERVLISASGDLAVEFGNYSQTGSGPDGTGSDRGSYVTVYQKSDGAWKVKADASASSMPAAPSGM